ncbi:MAG: amidohydrolase family protein [Oscillochloris sp.]|nr:amidohydrolase family protein [Oscillochloris sp.]
MSHWQQLQADRALFEQTLHAFLPARIFDAHVHLYRHAHYGPAGPPPLFAATPSEVDWDRFIRDVAWLHGPKRTVGALCFGLTFNGERAANDAFVAAETGAARAQGFAALPQLIVGPGDDPDMVREQVRRAGYVGLKPYHTLAQTPYPTWHAPLAAYFPEPLAQVAHDEGLTVTLHLVRARALADPANQATLRRYAERYPNMRLILAHAGRGFNPWHTIEGVAALANLANLWFDTSAVTEAGGFEAIIDTFGHTRLLYGSDFPISQLRGRCVAVGDSFHWLYAEGATLGENHGDVYPALVGLESLRALRLACRRLRLSDTQIEDLFYGNAAQLFALST